MTDKLKPVRCECGGGAHVVQYSVKDWDLNKWVPAFYVECKKCGIRTIDYPTEAEAVTAWNRAMGATDINVGDKFAKDINVPNKEIVIIEPLTTGIDYVGYCMCGNLVNTNWKYCPECGREIQWGVHYE